MLSWFYRTVVRPLLFGQESESIHDQTLAMLARAAKQKPLCDVMAEFLRPEDLPVEVFGLKFPNPVGLAAGMDKRASCLPVWERIGFGFCEIGGVTRHAQDGNPSPRMFRAVKDEALINRMGFNNPGAEKMAETLADWKQRGLWPKHPVGINLGKSKITENKDAASDYAFSFKALREYGDFFVVNVSSPNTPNLRELQDKDALHEILAALDELNVADDKAPKRPILVKVSPDLTFEALDQVIEVAQQHKLAGIVATNTTISRPETTHEESKAAFDETGGLSGKPLKQRSTEIIRHIYKVTEGKLPIIGVGGIFTADDAWEKIEAGASLVQIYTALVYEGPSVAGRIVDGLRRKIPKELIRK